MNYFLLLACLFHQADKVGKSIKIRLVFYEKRGANNAFSLHK